MSRKSKRNHQALKWDKTALLICTVDIQKILACRLAIYIYHDEMSDMITTLEANSIISVRKARSLKSKQLEALSNY